MNKFPLSTNSIVIVPRSIPNIFKSSISTNNGQSTVQSSLPSSPTPPALDLASSSANQNFKEILKMNNLATGFNNFNLPTETSSAFRPLFNCTNTSTPSNSPSSFNDFLALALSNLVQLTPSSTASSTCDVGQTIDFSTNETDYGNFNDASSAASSSASKNFLYYY